MQLIKAFDSMDFNFLGNITVFNLEKFSNVFEGIFSILLCKQIIGAIFLLKNLICFSSKNPSLSFNQ